MTDAIIIRKPIHLCFTRCGDKSTCVRLAIAAALTLGLTLAPAARAQSSPPQPAAAATLDAVAVKKLIRQLDDDDPAVRERASLRVNSLDGRAMDVVEEGLRSPDVTAETEARLKTAMKYIKPRAVRGRERAARAAWESRTLHEAYEKFGQTGPAFDEPRIGQSTCSCSSVATRCAALPPRAPRRWPPSMRL